MDIYILDRNFNVLDVITVYEDILWKSVLNEPGTFKADFVYTDRLMWILTKNVKKDKK